MNADYETIENSLRRNVFNCYAIDDSQYLMVFDSFRRAKELGYGKFTDIAVDFYKLFEVIEKETSPDTIVYLLQHAEKDDQGMIRAKTIGKMLDNQLVLEGMCETVLYADTDGKKYTFQTQSNGMTTAKSPMGVLPFEMENDLKVVDSKLRELWDMKPLKDNKLNGNK